MDRARRPWLSLIVLCLGTFAVLLDATIVRAVLLPAAMILLGDWNWYLPRWLEWLPRVTPPAAPPLPAIAVPQGTSAPEPAPQPAAPVGV